MHIIIHIYNYIYSLFMQLNHIDYLKKCIHNVRKKSLHVAIVWPYIMSIHVNTMVGGSDKSIQYGPRKMQKDAIYQYHYVFESEIEPAITFCICLGLPLSIF